MTFAKTFLYKDKIKLTLIGQHLNLTAYYEGDDGKAYAYSAFNGFSNEGDIARFRQRFEQLYRGVLTK